MSNTGADESGDNFDGFGEQFCSVDFFRWPFRSLIRSVWRNDPRGTILYFPRLVLRRLPWFRPPLTLGFRYPAKVLAFDFTTLPPRFRVSIESRLREAAEVGFGDVRHYQFETIGTHKQFLSVAIHESREVLFQVSWTLTEFEGNWYIRHSLVISSALQQGGAFATILEADGQRYPELQFTPDVQVRSFSETTSTAALFDYHRQATPAEAIFKRFQPDTAIDYLTQRIHEKTDALLQRKLYVMLSEQEIERIEARKLPPIE